MERTVDILIEISIYSAVITAFILLFRAAFKKRISPKVQYAMWLLLVLRLMLPVTIESGFHVESLLPERPAPVVQEESIFEAENPAINEFPAVNMAPVTEVAPIQPIIDTQGENTVPPVISQEIPESTVVSLPEVKEPAFNIRWRIAAFWTWVAGALVFGLWMMIVKLRFYEDMQRHTTSVSPRTYAIYDECCAALKVKPITMWAVDRAISPGIAFFTYPVLLLPASMDGDEEKLRYAFLHELTHKKRRDHYMTALLTALRIIYWFNPAVHIGFSEMRADMETACDADVIAFVGREQKRGYLTAILELFSYATRPQLGMSQASSRRMAKQRMKGAFMRERTTFLGRAAALMLAVIMLVGCFTTACQEAPAEGYEGPVPVIGTDDWQSTVVDEINAYSSDTDYFGNTNIKANTIAINPRFFPPGTEFYIDGIGYFAGLDFLHWHGETDTKNMLSIYMDNEKQVHDFDAMYNTKVLYRMPNYDDADSPYSREYAEGMVTSQVINRLSSCSEELLNNVPTDMASNTLYDDVKKLTDTMGLFLKGVSYAEKHQRLHCNVQMVELPCSYELGRVYSAVMFALIPELYDITIGNWSYYEYYGTIYKRTDTVPPESSVGEVIAREDIAAYYAELIMKPLEEYGTSGSGIRELLSAIAKVRGVNGALSGITDVDGDGLEDTITVDADNTADENFTPETAKATLTVKLGRGETTTQEIPGWWQNAEYHTADFDADNRTDIALMLWVGGSNYDATNVYVYHMGNSKLTELAKNVITNDTITYDQSRYSVLNGENAPWISGGTVISEGGKSKLRLRQILDYDPGAGIATAYYTNLVWNGSGWFIESMEIGEAFGEEQIYPDTLQYAPMPPDPIDTLSDMDLLIYSSLTNNSKVYALPRTLSGNDLSTSIWDNILLTVNDRYFDGKPYDAAGAAYNVVQVRYNDDGTIDVYLILSYRQYDILNDELSVTGELNCAVIWQYKENESGEIEFSNVYWPIKDSKGRVSYANKNWPEDLQKYLEFSPDSIGRAERLKAIDEQIAISIDNNEKVDALLSTIVSGPKGSSAPIDYIHEHVGEYGQLCAMGRRAVSRFMPRFEAGKETGLEGQIMAAVLNALTGADSVYNYENGQEWYDDNRNEMLAYLQTAVQPTPALDASNPEWQAAKRIAAPFSETGKRIDLSYYEVSIDLNGTERISAMTENNVTPDQFDRTGEGQTLLLIYRASADAINDSNRMEDLFLQFARISRFETVTEFIQLDHAAYFDADSPVCRMDKMTSVMDIAEPGWNDTAYTTYFVYLTPQWDYRGQTQSQNIVLGFRFVNAVRGDIGGWKLLQTEADCEKWMGTVEFGDAFASMPKPTPTPASTELANAIVTDAKALVGKPYKKGTYGPDTFDSSGLVHYVITQAGVYVERMENCQRYADNANWQKIEDKAKLQPGDIMFFYGGDTEKIQHAGIYIGDGKMVDASASIGKVAKRSWETDYWQEHFAFARRVA